MIFGPVRWGRETCLNSALQITCSHIDRKTVVSGRDLPGNGEAAHRRVRVLTAREPKMDYKLSHYDAWGVAQSNCTRRSGQLASPSFYDRAMFTRESGPKRNGYETESKRESHMTDHLTLGISHGSATRVASLRAAGESEQ